MELVIEVIKMLVNLLQDSGARPILIVLVVVMFGIVGLVVWGRGEVRLGPVHLNFRRKEVPDEARASGSGDQVGSEEGPGGKLGGMDGGWNKGPLKSQHVVTRVLSRKKAGLLVEGPKIEDASHDAAEFYGYRGDEAKRLHGMTLADLLERLRPFMKPGDFDAFRSDQMRMGNDYNEGKPVMAEIPIVFNGGHPFQEYQKRVFYPVISHSEAEEKGEEQKESMTVLYVDLKKIPKKVFGYVNGAKDLHLVGAR